MTAARILLDVALLCWWAKTVAVVVGRPATRWKWGRTGRIIAVLLAAVFVGYSYGVFLPWGAAVVWWTRLRGESPAAELPMADGRPQR